MVSAPIVRVLQQFSPQTETGYHNFYKLCVFRRILLTAAAIGATWKTQETPYQLALELKSPILNQPRTSFFKNHIMICSSIGYMFSSITNSKFPVGSVVQLRPPPHSRKFHYFISYSTCSIGTSLVSPGIQKPTENCSQK